MMAARFLAGGKEGGDVLLLALRMNREISESGYFNRIKELIEQLRTADADASGRILARLGNDMIGYKNDLLDLDKAPANLLLFAELKPYIDNAANTLSDAISVVESMAGNGEKQSSIERLKELFRLKK